MLAFRNRIRGLIFIYYAIAHNESRMQSCDILAYVSLVDMTATRPSVYKWGSECWRGVEVPTGR